MAPATPALADSLRLLVLADTIEIGGAGKVALQAIGWLAHQGVAVTVANFDHPGRPSRFSAAARAAGAELVPLRQRNRLDWSWMETLVAAARRRRCNLLESHSFKAHVAAWRLQGRLRGPRGAPVPWLAFAHGWTRETLRVRAYNALEKRLLRRPDALCVVAPSIERILREAGREGPIHLLRNALEPGVPPTPPERAAARAAAGLAEGERLAAVIGRLSHEKGVDVLLEALARLPTGTRLRTHVAGEGPDRAALETRAAALGLGTRVRFLGQLADVRPLLAAADLLVLPSRSEGLPNVVLEALDCACPVVATRVGALPELVQPGLTGWLVAPEDPRALATALAEAAAAEDLAARGLAGRTRVLPAFSAGARLARLGELYARLLADGTRA